MNTFNQSNLIANYSNIQTNPNHRYSEYSSTTEDIQGAPKPMSGPAPHTGVFARGKTPFMLEIICLAMTPTGKVSRAMGAVYYRRYHLVTATKGQVYGGDRNFQFEPTKWADADWNEFVEEFKSHLPKPPRNTQWGKPLPYLMAKALPKKYKEENLISPYISMYF